MSFSITHRMGDSEDDPPLGRLDALIAELDEGARDPEHPDVSVTHDDSGWNLSAYPSGAVIWENLDEPEAPPRHMFVSRERLKALMVALAEGRLGDIEREDWKPGQGT